MAHRVEDLFTDVRVFCRVVAGAFGYGWSVYLAIQGPALLESENSATTIARGLSLAFLIPALLSVVAIWAAVVAEEGIIWTMSIGLVVFTAIFVFAGGLLFAPVAVGHLVVVALSRPVDRLKDPRSPRRRPGRRQR